MTNTLITAVVEDRKVILPPDVDWPNGTIVRVEAVESTQAESTAPAFEDIMRRYRGIAKDLPPDLAENHDHYIHGLPKKKK